jgi:hypothetical protein
MDEAELARHVATLEEHEAEAARLEQRLATIRAEGGATPPAGAASPEAADDRAHTSSTITTTGRECRTTLAARRTTARFRAASGPVAGCGSDA